MNFSRHIGQTAQANGQHTVRDLECGGGVGWGRTRNFPLIFKSVSPPIFSVSTKGQVGDLLGSVVSFHIRLHKKLICKWKEGLSKVHQLRDHIGPHEYKTVCLRCTGTSGDRESKIP